MKKVIKIYLLGFLALLCSLVFLSITYKNQNKKTSNYIKESVVLIPYQAQYPHSFTTEEQALAQKLARVAFEQTKETISYDPSHFVIDYPMGDVPADKGVCTDVVIRAYRQLNVDLQELVHEDMKNNFKLYPDLWNLKGPDTNIDHRRVPNLQVFFTRHGQSLEISKNGLDYLPGDLVTWDLTGKGKAHIGIVSAYLSSDLKRPLVIHNIGRGPEINDALFKFEITGHYRYLKEE